ncbi:serine carboxypeptidase-like 18 [Rutidosis leptorrhynchoides]|uniref:serine carboxypeptidase-like 18 n=1 Tax=Rutidosis leptorrhynchoides TaxID=125765 RepID=UPI003A991760
MKLRSQSHDQASSWIMLLVLIIVVFVWFETIESQFVVKSLPGLVGDLPFTLETGYVGIGEAEDIQLFYTFIESEGNPKDDPLLVWFTGGPGCSSIFGLLYEVGPLTFSRELSTNENPVLELVPESLTKAANVIFLDQPAGTGYSYAKTPEAYVTNDTLSAIHANKFMRKWLVDHPKFAKNTVYLGGDSYMGIVLPMMVEEMFNGNEVGQTPQINIKGYMLGNPLTDRSGDFNSRIQYAHNLALISDGIYESTKKRCNEEYYTVDPNNTLCIHDLQAVDKCLDGLNTAQILEANCRDSNTLKSDLTRRGLRAYDKDSLNVLRQADSVFCRDDNYVYSYDWANRRDVREALHVSEELNDVEWVQCNETLHFNFDIENDISYTHNVANSVEYHRRLADKDCRALIYSGDHDLVIPYLSTLSWIELLNFPVVDNWKPWFVDNQVAGYRVKYVNNEYNLTFATVKGGGHTAPEYKHKESLSMLIRWLANDTF